MATTGKKRHATEHRTVLVLLVAVGLALAACGGGQTNAGSAYKAHSLVGTDWVIVEMTGFPDDNINTGTFGFTNDLFSFFDGINQGSVYIMWESGFTVVEGGTATEMGVQEGDPQPYLGNILRRGARVEIVQNADGSLTLTQGERSVTAKPA